MLCQFPSSHVFSIRQYMIHIKKLVLSPGHHTIAVSQFRGLTLWRLQLKPDCDKAAQLGIPIPKAPSIPEQQRIQPVDPSKPYLPQDSCEKHSHTMSRGFR